MKKLKLLALLALLPTLRLSAQISEVEELFVTINNDFVHYSSVVRNYNDTTNILVHYGRIEGLYAPDSVVGYSSFYIQNTKSGEIKHLFDLDRGYRVNDVRFVTLRMMDGVTTEDFCCFCGTRNQFDETLALPNPGNEPNIYMDIYSNHGFAGLFSMEDAFNPTTSSTAKVRDVENTKELYRMACYAEEYGHYYPEQNTYIDHIVMDIIGTDDTLFRPSCFCRAKCYPNHPTLGIRWDNNMRFNLTEVLTDITKTDDYVVTVSRHVNGNGDSLWVRHSDQEDHNVLGGMQLNGVVNSINFQTSLIEEGCGKIFEIGTYTMQDDAKICHTTNNKVEVGFHLLNYRYGGIINSQYDYVNGTMTFLKGAYMKSSPLIKELVYMPANDATAVLYKEFLDYVSVLKWKQDQNCLYPVNWFYHNDKSAQSITLQKRNGYEHLLWSGRMTGNTISNPFLMTQRGEQGDGYKESCHKRDVFEAYPVFLDHSTINKNMNIQLRYPYNTTRYPVTYIPFDLYEIEKEFPCLK